MIDYNKCDECSEIRCLLYKTPEEKYKKILDKKHTQNLIDMAEMYFNKAQEQLLIYTKTEKHNDFAAKRYDIYFNAYQDWTNKFNKKFNLDIIS